MRMERVWSANHPVGAEMQHAEQVVVAEGAIDVAVRGVRGHITTGITQATQERLPHALIHRTAVAGACLLQ